MKLKAMIPVSYTHLKFIESAENVSAGGSIEADSILHSKVTAKSTIKASGRNGLIIGGDVKAVNMIEDVYKRQGRTSSLIPSEKKASIDAISALRRRNEINDTIPPKVNPSRFTNIKSGSKKVVALACSTGGPKSLQQVIPMLPKNLDAGVVLVQHMPAGFTASLAARLNEISDINVKEGADGDVIQKGWVYIAPGGKHIEVVKKASEYVIKLNDEPPIDLSLIHI